MLEVDPKTTPVPQVHQYLLGGVAPRPIALVSTLSADGIRNLTPFSFFNAFGANPPTIAFSPARRGRDGTFKDTYNNLMATKECTVQAVTQSIMHQVNLASAEWAPEIDEFVKSGLTPVESVKVKPPRVRESPFQMECVLKQMIPLGDGRAAGNLAICEVVLFHIDERLLEGNIIIPGRIEHVARNGGDWWSRVTAENAFHLPKPKEGLLIGFDNLPEYVRRSHVLSANNLGQLANFESMPTVDEARQFMTTVDTTMNSEALRLLKYALQSGGSGANEWVMFENAARTALDLADDRRAAWHILVYGHSLIPGDR
ncbi:MAG: flavin reductase family protein [candidate division Zixibacteria bacterium]|nr:flavin reductase family protein [candidate division Zixibacteria bacterium]